MPNPSTGLVETAKTSPIGIPAPATCASCSPVNDFSPVSLIHLLVSKKVELAVAGDQTHVRTVDAPARVRSGGISTGTLSNPVFRITMAVLPL